jgi:hypothetical protein
MKMDETCQIVVCSCDRYRDVWPAFFRLFWKYWPACPYPVNLVSNGCDWDDRRVAMRHVSASISWTKALRESIDSLDSDYVLLLLEDYLVNDTVDTDGIGRLIAFMRDKGIGCLYLYPANKYEASGINVAGYALGDVPPRAPFRVNTQAGLWRRDFILETLFRDESGWDYEVNATRHSEAQPDGFLTVMRENPRLPFPYYCTGVVRGKWTPGAVALCKKEGITLDFGVRPVGWVRGLFRDVWVLQPIRHLFVWTKRLFGKN